MSGVNINTNLYKHLKSAGSVLPTLKDSWFAILCYFLFGFVINLFVLLFAKIPDMLVLYIASVIPPFAYLFFVQARKRLSTGISIPINNPCNGKFCSILLYFCVALLAFTIQVVMDPLTSWMEMPDSLKKLMDSIVGGTASQIICVVVAAPLLEELLLRGFMERGMIYHIGWKKAIFWSALIFAVMHLNPWQGIPAFIMGLVFGWIYWRTHNLSLTILMHFIVNGSSVLLVRVFPDFSTSDTFLKDVMQYYYGGNSYALLVVLCTIITIVLFYCLNKYLAKGEELFPQIKE